MPTPRATAWPVSDKTIQMMAQVVEIVAQHPCELLGDDND
jgi:hypothetical protein